MSFLPIDDGGCCRRSGRSTAIGLTLIAEALLAPNRRVSIKDHYPTRLADKFLMRMMQEQVGKLGLEGFTFYESELGAGVLFNFPR